MSLRHHEQRLEATPLRSTLFQLLQRLQLQVIPDLMVICFAEEIKQRKEIYCDAESAGKGVVCVWSSGKEIKCAGLWPRKGEPDWIVFRAVGSRVTPDLEPETGDQSMQCELEERCGV